MPEHVPAEDVGWRQGRKQPQNLYLNGRYAAVAFEPHVAAQLCRALNRELDRAAEAAVQARARLDAEIKGHALDAERRGECVRHGAIGYFVANGDWLCAECNEIFAAGPTPSERARAQAMYRAGE